MMLLAALTGYWMADFCMVKAALHLNPLAATLGAAINVPVSVCIDLFAHNRSFTGQFAGGAVLCVLAFGRIAVIELESVRKLVKCCCKGKKSLAEQRENIGKETDLLSICSHEG